MSNESLPVRSPALGILMYTGPIVMIIGVFGLYAYFLWHGFAGRMADGNTVTITLATCSEAREAIETRLQTMGFDHETRHANGELQVTTQLPSDPTVATQIPLTLVQRGHFEVRAENEAVLLRSDVVTGALIRLDVSLNPTTAVLIEKDAAIALRRHQESKPEGTLSFWVDGERIGGRNNRAGLTGAEIELVPNADNDKARMEAAAHWAMAVNAPLPCEATLVSVTTVKTE